MSIAVLSRFYTACSVIEIRNISRNLPLNIKDFIFVQKWKMAEERQSSADASIAEDLICPLCHSLAQNPQQTTCNCSHLYCKMCFEQQKQNSRLCPNCKCELCAFPDRLSARRIQDLELRCSAGQKSGLHLPQEQRQSAACSKGASTYNRKKISDENLTEVCEYQRRDSGGMTADEKSQFQCMRDIEECRNRDDLIILYLPCIIICFMIVCIVISAFALGHV